MLANPVGQTQTAMDRAQRTMIGMPLAALLLLGSASMAMAQTIDTAGPAPAAADTGAEAAPVIAAQTMRTIRSLQVAGNERLEPETVRSYVAIGTGDPYDREALDKALKDLFATELFSDVQILDDGSGNITIQIKENPVINRVIIEGSKRVKEDKIREEIKVGPRQIFTRSRASADVARILELYRRSGRFAARVEPKIIRLEQNRVDLIFEIVEGPKSKIRQINIIGNREFSDKKLRGQMVSKQARPMRIFTSNDTYDPDRLAFDQQKLRQYYLTKGYADFRVVSSVAELTPDRRDFLVTYVIEEGDRYKFGEVDLESQIRDVKEENFEKLLPMKKGDWYNAKLIEDTIDGLTESVGLLGYAFANVRPNFDRDKDNLEMNISFIVHETPRTYVESVTINGNTRTHDEVIRREFRIAEGDAFNSVKVKRSRDRIQSLGFFQDKLDIKESPGSANDKVALQIDVEERPTGSLQLSAGYSSLESFIFSFAIEQRNFRGRGQTVNLSANISSYSKSIVLGFLDPYLFGRNLALGFDIFRRDYNSFTWNMDGKRRTTYEQTTTGFQVRVGTAITEFWQGQLRYGLSRDKVGLSQEYFSNGQCDPLIAGRYLCDALGNYTTSSLGYSLMYNSLDNRMRPSRGQQFVFSQDIAGLGGTVRYIRTRINYDKYFRLPANFILNLGGEAGNIFGLGQDVRLSERYYLGEPNFRGFAIRGVGPRIIRKYRDADGNTSEDRNTWADDAIGGKNYYLARAEVEIPLGSAGREMGLRPSFYVDAGALWRVNTPELLNVPNSTSTVCTDDTDPDTCTTSNITGFREFAYGNSATPRVSVGLGVSWNSPFGPFRFDFAKAVRTVRGDDTQVFQFNVGTQF